MIHPARLQSLNAVPPREGRYVLYWMQASQRAQCNHALEYAVRQANERKLPVLAVFGLTANFPEANARHYAFMLEGLRETQAALQRRGIPLVARLGSPPEVALQLARDAALLVMDRGYLRLQKQWRQEVARRAPCPVVQVETDVVVPVEVASAKEEYAARTIRPRIQRHLETYLVPLRETRLKRKWEGPAPEGLDLTDVNALLRQLGVSGEVAPVAHFTGGTSQGLAHLEQFLTHRLARYDTDRNEPKLDATSHVSPYLHFGQLSPLEIALAVREYEGPGPVAYLEELLVRRELSCNFVHHNAAYDSYEALPGWARDTLARHARDRREYLYTREQFERAQTHDPYWNAAMQEMLLTGYMHNYMRMYWGKKIIEWSRTPEEAYTTLLYLNNKYFLDGRDPASFTNVAWCFGKHDRPWQERPVFGTVRYMNAAGLNRKFDMAGYVQRVSDLAAGCGGR